MWWDLDRGLNGVKKDKLLDGGGVCTSNIQIEVLPRQ